MNPGELAPLKLLIRGFGIRVPGGAPVLCGSCTRGGRGPAAVLAGPGGVDPLPSRAAISRALVRLGLAVRGGRQRRREYRR